MSDWESPQPATVKLPSSYVIYNDGANTKAFNGTTGVIDYSGTDAATVINNTINTLSNGGYIFIKAGTYNMSAPIILASGVTLEGEGFRYSPAGGTFFYLNNGVNADMFTSLSSARLSNAQIKNIVLNGNPANQASGDAIHLYAPYKCIIRDVWIMGAKDNGIRLQVAGVSTNGNATQLENVSVFGCGIDGIVNDNYTTDICVLNCIVQQNTRYGINVTGTNYITNTEVCFSQYCIYLAAASGTMVTACELHDASQDIINGWNVTETMIIGNNFYKAGANYSGILLDSNGSRPSIHNMIIGNTIGDGIFGTETQKYGIKTAGNTDYNVIMANAIGGSQTAPMSIIGTHELVKGNPGYLTENNVLSATFAIDSTGVKTVTIAHGLAITPAVQDCFVTPVEVTAVDDWAYNLLKVVSTDGTNVVAKIKVSTASGTGGATAKLGLRVGNP